MTLQTEQTKNSYLSLLGHRYSCREFGPQQLTDHELGTILEAARISPSARNCQPTRLRVVQDAEGLAKIDECTRCRYGAPTAIIVAYDDEAAAHANPTHGPEVGDFGLIDASIAITNMDNAAAGLGLGACWIGAFNPQKVRELFDIPESYRLVELLMVGHAVAGPSSMHSSCRPLDEILF